MNGIFVLVQKGRENVAVSGVCAYRARIPHGDSILCVGITSNRPKHDYNGFQLEVYGGVALKVHLFTDMFPMKTD